MSDITKANASMDTVSAQYTPPITGLYAGEALGIAVPCYIDSSDGLVYQCVTSGSTAGQEGIEAVGFTARATKSGEPVTLFGNGVRFRYAAAMTPGDRLYVSGTAGKLSDAQISSDDAGVAMVLTATDILVTLKWLI